MPRILAIVKRDGCVHSHRDRSRSKTTLSRMYLAARRDVEQAVARMEFQGLNFEIEAKPHRVACSGNPELVVISYNM